MTEPGSGLSPFGAPVAGAAACGCPGTDFASTCGAAGCRPRPVRPYQLLCAVCALGDAAGTPALQYAAGRELLTLVRRQPDTPLTLSCVAGPLFAYQDSGTAADTPEGEEYNRKRDLDVLQLLGLAPGTTLPARALLKTLLMGVSTVSGICGYASVSGPGWSGCALAESGNYERGHARGIDALAPPRSSEEMAAEKERSLAALRAAEVVPVRPHIVACAVCQYGAGIRPPFADDNLPELLDLIVTEKPDLPIQMAPGADWMICAPCPGRVPEASACCHVWGCGELDSQKRDLDLLQLLGLRFGSTMPARDLYRLLFDRVVTIHGVPAFCQKHNTVPSVWWDECAGHLYHANPSARFEKGRRELRPRLGLAGTGVGGGAAPASP